MAAAEQAGFDVLVTTDSNLRYQQNLAGRTIAIVVLTGTTKWTACNYRPNGSPPP